MSPAVQAVSRGQYDARIYTDDKVKLARALDRDVSNQSALEKGSAERLSRPSREHQNTRSGSIGQTMAVGPS